MKVFHHNDLDGRCAAAVVLHHLNHRTDIECIEVDYKDTIDVEAIQPGEPVVIVDFSFKPEVMDKVLERTLDVTWIDHHKTALEYLYSRELAGLRDDRYSGCELAWMYYAHPAAEMPLAVALIGDRDKWAWKMRDQSEPFNQGMKLYPHAPTDAIWGELFDAQTRDASVAAVIEAGKTCMAFRDSLCADYLDKYGYLVTFEGFNCMAVNLSTFGSETFGLGFSDYDLCISYVYDGANWTVGLYSQTVDVSEIAKRYGGGGHMGAAGFVTKELPFVRR